METPKDFVRVVDRTRYDVSKSQLLASDCYWDGSNFERHGRNTWLYRTANGRYFTVTKTQWQGERDSLTPVTLEEAIELYEYQLPEHEVEYEDAFPDVEILEA